MKSDLAVSGAKHLYRRCFAVAFVLFATIPCVSFGQSLEDFERAAGSEGVNLIPFASLRTDSSAIAREVDTRKDEMKSFNKYSIFYSQKNNVLKEIKKENEDIEKIKKEIDDFKSDHPDGNVSPFEEEIEKAKKEIAENNEKIKAMNEQMEKAADSCERLYHARAGLREYFEEALNQVSEARSNPDKYLGANPTDEERSKLKEAAERIEDKIKQEAAFHKDQEEGAKGTTEKLKELIRMDQAQ